MFTIKGEHPLSWGYLNANKSRLELTEQQEATDKNGKFLQLNQVVQEGCVTGSFFRRRSASIGLVHRPEGKSHSQRQGLCSFV